MTLQSVLQLGLIVVAFSLGALAAVNWRRQGVSTLAGFGLAVDRRTPLDFLVGLFITSLAMVGILVVELMLALIQTTPNAFDGASLISLAGSLIYYAAEEEFIFRSLLLTGLLVILRGRAWAAVLVTGAVFGLVHATNAHASVSSVIGNGLGGIIYALAFVRTGRIWAPLGLHFAWNFVQGPVLGFPVSGYHFGGIEHVVNLGPNWVTGGDYGPEAGAIGIAARFFIIAAVMVWTSAAYRGDQSRSLAAPTPDLAFSR